MRIVALTMAAGALLVVTQANAASVPVNRMTGVTPDLVDQVAVRVYVHEGHRYCFYFNGWHGAGWYRCGFAHRRGIGWGGVYGWNDWGYGPAERRFGRHESGASFGTRMQSGQSGTRVQTRSSTTNGTKGNVQMRSRTTTGSGAGMNIQSGGKVQGGTSGGTAVQGGASGKATTGAAPQEQKKQ